MKLAMSAMPSKLGYKDLCGLELTRTTVASRKELVRDTGLLPERDKGFRHLCCSGYASQWSEGGKTRGLKETWVPILRNKFKRKNVKAKDADIRMK